MAAVRLALHVRTRYRAEFASPGSQSAGYGRAVWKARTPSMAAPAPSGLTSGSPFLSYWSELRVCGRRNCERANTWSDHATVALPQYERTTPGSGCDVTMVK